MTHDHKTESMNAISELPIQMFEPAHQVTDVSYADAIYFWQQYSYFICDTHTVRAVQLALESYEAFKVGKSNELSQ